MLAPDKGELIYYERADQEGPKHSEYHLARTHDPENLKTVLSMAFGIRGVVVKSRYLFMVGQTRIHLDDVEGLGQFIELEVVLEDWFGSPVAAAGERDGHPSARPRSDVAAVEVVVHFRQRIVVDWAVDQNIGR